MEKVEGWETSLWFFCGEGECVVGLVQVAVDAFVERVCGVGGHWGQLAGELHFGGGEEGAKVHLVEDRGGN